jgi:hypothetical protein
VLPLLQLPNSTSISLRMHCFHCILTSLISQALLQAALDRRERDFTGWFIQYEFLGFTSRKKHSNILCNANASATIDWQPPEQPPVRHARSISSVPGLAVRSSVSASSHGSSSNGKSAWHNYLVEIGSPPFPHSRPAKRRDGSTLLPLEQDPLAGIRLPYDQRTGGIAMNGRAPEHFRCRRSFCIVATIRSCYPDRSITLLIDRRMSSLF